MRTTGPTGTTPTRSPESFIGGMTTSSNPGTPQTALPATSHEDGLRARVGAAATSLAQRVKLPQAADALRNASVTQALQTVVKDAVAPATSLAGNVLGTVAKATRQSVRPSMSSQPLQAALSADLTQDAAQMNAHAAAVAYGQHSAKFLDRAVPFLFSAARIGVAGTSMAFGVGRNTGTAAGDTAGHAERGATEPLGVFAGAQSAARTMSSRAAFLTAAAGVQQWALGSMAGAVGNLVGQFVATPLVNMLPRQFQPIDARAVVPQHIVEDMNHLAPGAGNALRDAVAAQQVEISNVASASNVRVGEVAFDSFTAARMAAVSATPLGIAGQVGLGLAVSASAGATIGGVMAIRQSVATIQVPDAAALRQAVESAPADGAAALAAVPTQAVPLFFARHTHPETAPTATVAQASQREQMSHMRTAVSRASEAIATASPPPTPEREQASHTRTALSQAGQVLTAAANTIATPGRAIAQAFMASPLLEPQPSSAAAIPDGRLGRTAATVSNVVASGVRRAALMAGASTTTSLMSTGSAMLAGATDGMARRTLLAVGNAIGIHAAVKPWFTALARDIPAGDSAMRTQRQHYVDAHARIEADRQV